MSVLTAGFSERVFEFSFNAEYADRNRAVLAGAPHIPTQNEEKWLGYDVAFEVTKRGGAVHAVALQHKVSRYVDNRGPTNAHFWSIAGGPYFAFRLDTDQYNLIQSISSAGLPGIEFHFCAPLFSSRIDMNTHYLGKEVEQNSIWIDVRSGGQINDDDTHSIVYPESGGAAFRFSKDPVPLNVVGADARRMARAQRDAASLKDVRPIYEAALRTLREYWPSRRRSNAVDAENSFRMPDLLPEEQVPTVANTAKLLGQYFGVSLLVEVRK